MERYTQEELNRLSQSELKHLRSMLVVYLSEVERRIPKAARYVEVIGIKNPANWIPACKAIMMMSGCGLKEGRALTVSVLAGKKVVMEITDWTSKECIENIQQHCEVNIVM